MNVFSILVDHIDRLVHPDALASDIERSRQRAFICTRSGIFLAAAACVPLYLASGSVPSLWQAAALAWLSIPLGAAVYVSATGRMRIAEMLSLLAWMGFGATACFGGMISLAAAWGLMLLMPLEALSTFTAGLVARGVLLAAIGVTGLELADLAGLLPASATAHSLNDAAVVLPALIYASVLALAASRVQAVRQTLQWQGEERYRVLSEAVGDLVLRYDRTGGVTMASREAERLFGIQPRDLLGRGFFERVHVADRPAFLKLFSDAANTSGSVAASLRLRVSDLPGEQGGFAEPVFAWVELRARRFEGSRNSGDKADHQSMVAVVRDITAQTKHEQAMAQARAEAEQANNWKDVFLANVSHELRTPLNAIIGFSEMLGSKELAPREPEKQREYAAIITASGHHLLSVVNSLLDISKMEAGCFDISPEPFELPELVRSCCEMVSLKAEQAGITVHQTMAARVDEIVGDKRACRQIVINLLSNALKFTPAGGRVDIAVQPQGNSVLLTVADTGVGIAARDLCRLGDAFFQAEAGYDRPHEGTGLGLSVVKGLVGLHGGTISLESAPGQGTCVTVRLPLDCSKAGPTGAVKIKTIPRYAGPVASPAKVDITKVQKIA